MNNNSIGSWFTAPVIILVVAVAILGWLWSSYNGMVKGNLAVDTQWAQVESQYQRRFDLIPNLVSSVQGAMKQEQKVFDDIAQARTQYSGAQSVDQKAAGASNVESALGRLLVVMENYPQLKSIDTVQSLMAELSGTENRIAVERMRFNESVQGYNILVKTFPGSLIAGMFGFAPRTPFAAAAGADKAPQVQINP